MLLAAARAGMAGEPAGMKPQIDPLARPLLESRNAMGLAIGVIDQGKTAVFGYGRISRAVDRPPDGQTVFEIGSVTKVFTGLILADMAQEKLVGLEDPVQKYLPESVKVPRQGDRAITLVDLATHTSGLPRLPPNLLAQVAAHPEDPYARYTVKDLYEGLPACPLASMPGSQFAYSNLGMALLGHVLARREGTTYERLIRRRICEPLGMTQTSMELSAAQRSRLAPGHNLDAMPAGNWDLGVFAGAGGLRSTVDDLLLFLAANLALRPSRLDAAIALSHQPRHDAGKPDGRIALGWHLSAKESIYWHNGETGGYHSFVAFQPQRKVGVVVLGNMAGRAVDQLGNEVLKILLGRPATPIKVRIPARLDPATFDRYVGTYRLSPQFALTIFREGDSLMARGTGQPALRIFPESETKFYYRLVEARITFVKDQEGKINQLILHQHGRDMPGKREK